MTKCSITIEVVADEPYKSVRNKLDELEVLLGWEVVYQCSYDMDAMHKMYDAEDKDDYHEARSLLQNYIDEFGDSPETIRVDTILHYSEVQL
jgi:hypothetical protein